MIGSSGIVEKCWSRWERGEKENCCSENPHGRAKKEDRAGIVEVALVHLELGIVS